MKQVTLIVVSALWGILARDLLVSTVRADEEALLRRSDVNAIVRALEKQAEATRELVSATKERCR
jgi:hypothetical protein